MTAGAGWKLADLNKELSKYGFYIPINKNYLDKRLYEIVKQNSARFDSPSYSSISNLIEEMMVALPNGSMLVVGNLFGFGTNTKDLFIGANATTGFLCEAELKI